jgi:hypothetical protein
MFIVYKKYSTNEYNFYILVDSKNKDNLYFGASTKSFNKGMRVPYSTKFKSIYEYTVIQFLNVV